MGALALVAFLMAPSAAGQSDPVVVELNKFWAEVSRTVAEGDFEGMKATYHPDAVHVTGDGASYVTRPLAKSLAADEADIALTRNGEKTAGVAFRFTSRIHDDTTAHEVGVVHYWVTYGGKPREDHYLRLDSYLVKRDRWMIILEIQTGLATKAEWDALR
jgi:hypothetical protein